MISRVAGPDETKNRAGREVLRRGSDPLSRCRVSKKSLQSVKAISRRPLNQTGFQAKRPGAHAWSGHTSQRLSPSSKLMAQDAREVSDARLVTPHPQ